MRYRADKNSTVEKDPSNEGSDRVQAGRTPVYGDFKEPAPRLGDSRIAVTAAALSPVVKSRAAGAHYSAAGDFPLCRGHRWRRTARRWPARLFHPAEGALWQHGANGRRAVVAVRDRARWARRHHRRRHRQSRPVVMGGVQGARQVRARRDRAGQWRNRNVRPPGRSDRKISGRRARSSRPAATRPPCNR